MRKQQLLWTALTLGLVGCLSGTYLTTAATWTGTGPGAGWYGFDVAGGFRAEPRGGAAVAVGAPAVDKVYIHVPSSGITRKFTGETGGEAGWALAVGDFGGFGTGFSDLVIGAPSANSGKGRIHVLGGGSIYSDVSRRSSMIRLHGDAANEYAGISLAVGDFNGDGDDDLLIGACGRNSYAGRVYRVDGPIAAGDHTLASRADFILDGATSSSLGCAVTASDVDGDGKDEVVASAWWGNVSKGQVFVIDGTLTGSYTTSTLPAGTSSVLSGAVTGHQLGFSLDGGADFDGDGKEDLLIGEPRKVCSDPREGLSCPEVPGRAYLVRGADPFVGGAIASKAAATFTGATNGDVMGSAVTFVDDHNSDGYADIAIGARGVHKAYFWYGRPDPATNLGTVSATAADATIDGSTAGDNAGNALAPAGDIDGDGNMDLLIGARAVDWTYWSTPRTGEAHIFTGTE